MLAIDVGSDNVGLLLIYIQQKILVRSLQNLHSTRITSTVTADLGTVRTRSVGATGAGQLCNLQRRTQMHALIVAPHFGLSQRLYAHV